MANDALKIVTHEDLEQGKRPVVRVGSSPPADALDPAKLMDMLGDIDGLKREIQDRIRRIEAVKQAKSLLEEDALRTEALNKRLAEIGKVMSAVHSGILESDHGFDETEVIRMQGREAALPEGRPAALKVIHESVALPWPKAEEFSPAEVRVAEVEEAAPELTAAATQDVAVELPVAEVELPEVEIPENVAAFLESVAVPEIAPVEAVAVEVAAPEVVEEEFAATEVGQPEAVTADLVAVEVSPKPELIEAPTEIAIEMAPVAAQSATDAHALSRVEELVQMAQRMLDESSARLELAMIREEQVASDLQSTQEALLTTYQSAAERLTQAERYWKLADDAAVETRGLFEDSTAQLALAASKEQKSAADFQSAQQALAAAYHSACQRLEAAERYCREGDGFAQETKKLLDRMQAELADARNGATTATEDLLSARQELTTAYQFASVAAQRRLDSAEFFRKTTSWVVFSTAFAWMATIWMAWVAFQRVLPIAVPVAASCVILAGGMFLRRRGFRQVEET